MNKAGMNITKESTKIRRQINRQRRHLIKRKLREVHDETKIPVFRNTEGWETW
ncbi:MAG: hypothetical protein HW405_30 [Candidatus Berkelbacteria bacterium]|nr:hypothetical protein [Candidatus Berkelbacteria bacterium]